MLCINDYYYCGYFEVNKRTGTPINELLKAIPFCASYKLPPTDDTYPCPYDGEDGNVFLNFSCNLFAKALHQVFDYIVLEAQEKANNHWFCMCSYNTRELYIDVRGATSDFQEFSRPYVFMKSETNPKPIIKNETDMYFDDEAWRDTGILYAHSIISSYRHFYGYF